MEYKTIRVNDIKEVPQEGAYHIILANGAQLWYLNGKLYREDGPAVICIDESQWWYLNGQLHRADGPAIIQANGAKLWYLNGQLHRADGPAVLEINGYEEWWFKGQRHREDGPAIIETNGSKGWYLNGCRVSENTIKNPKALTINEIINWKNAEGKREMIRIYGLERFIFDSNPDIIDMDYHDQNGHRVLLKVKGIGGQWLCCSCPSTGRTYFMGAPDWVKSCEDADEWLSGSLGVKQVGRT